MNTSFEKSILRIRIPEGIPANTLENRESNFHFREKILWRAILENFFFFVIFSDKFVTLDGRGRLISEFTGRYRHCRVIITTRNPLRIAAEDKESGDSGH